LCSASFSGFKPRHRFFAATFFGLLLASHLAPEAANFSGLAFRHFSHFRAEQGKHQAAAPSLAE
jgi:hypothetical protein